MRLPLLNSSYLPGGIGRSECYIRKKGVYWVQLNAGEAALGPNSRGKTYVLEC